MRRLIIGLVTSLILAAPALAEDPVKEPSLAEQVVTLTNKLEYVQGQLDDSKLETAKMYAKYIYVLRKYNEKAKKYKFAKIKE